METIKFEEDGSTTGLRNGQVLFREIISYNSIGKFVELTVFNGNNSIEEIRTWQFDMSNRILERCYLYPNRSLKYKETSQYNTETHNENGKLINEVTYDEAGNMTSNCFYEYSEAGELVREWRQH